jgi:hypothetical protein
MDDLENLLSTVSKKYSSDILLYSGGIDESGADTLISMISESENENVILCLCTYGGDPNSAYKMSRSLQEKYKSIYLFVHGYCKSAGTFIAIGSDKIIMSDFAEFGPLDVQLREKDELLKSSSGLNLTESLMNLREETKQFFAQMITELAMTAGLSTKISAEVASKLSIDFYAPIMSQIDPNKLGETRRALNIALEYGSRLINDDRGSLKTENSLGQLVYGYPDHGFVIDFKEAKQLFKSVEKPDEELQSIGKILDQYLKKPKQKQCVLKLFPNQDKENKNEAANDETVVPISSKNSNKHSS